MTSKRVYVFVKPFEQSSPVIAGRLDFHADRVDFRYEPNWIKSAAAFPFHPELLPLSATICTAKSLEGPLGVFRDSGPGAWGKEIIRRRHGKVDAADNLILSNNLLRIGVFRFSTSKEADQFKGEHLDSFTLEDIYVAVQSLESGAQLTEQQSIMLAQGASLDGMRPKSFVTIDDQSWIFKPPSRSDYSNNAVNEMIGMQLARACSIETPEVRLITLHDHKRAIAIKRFDTDGVNIHQLMSAGSAMGYADSEVVKRDYRHIAQTLIRLSEDPKADCLSLFKRMALNVMISNRDDHLYNQAIIRTDRGWQLSPVYDVVCGEGTSRVHALTIGEYGNAGNLMNVLSAAKDFGLNADQARTIIDGMVTVVGDWKRIALDNGISEAEANQVGWSILHQEIFVGYDKDIPTPP